MKLIALVILAVLLCACGGMSLHDEACTKLAECYGSEQTECIDVPWDISESCQHAIMDSTCEEVSFVWDWC